MNTITAVHVSKAVIVQGMLIKPEVLQIYLPVPKNKGTEGIRWLEDRLHKI